MFKLDPKSKEGPLLTLGRSMQPGSDQNHFCQPTDVAVDPGSGTVYVTDGYCNSRLVQFSPSGRFITQWGEGTQTLYLGFSFLASITRNKRLAIPPLGGNGHGHPILWDVTVP